MLESDLVPDCNDQEHHEHLQRHWQRSLKFKKNEQIDVVSRNKESRVDFEEMWPNERVDGHRHFLPIYVNDAEHFLVAIDTLSHPNLRKSPSLGHDSNMKDP